MEPGPADLTGLVGVDPAWLGAILVDLADRRLTVAAAESLTGGLLTALLTEIPGSSAVIRGGLVVYATDLKNRLAGVDAGLLAAVGPVHPEVALALARGARDRCATSVGLGLTGVAGPDSQGGAAVGTFYVALVGPGPHRTRTAHGLPVLDVTASSSRARVRAAAVRAAVQLLAELAADEFREHA